MSIFLTLISNEGQEGKRNPERFTAELPYFLYLVENDWEVSLLHVAHPEIETLDWTDADSKANIMSFDMNLPGSPFPTLLGQQKFALPPGNYRTLADVWGAIQYGLLRKRGQILGERAETRTMTKAQKENYFKQDYVSILNKEEWDSKVIDVPEQMSFRMATELAVKLKLVKIIPSAFPGGGKTAADGDNFLLWNLIDFEKARNYGVDRESDGTNDSTIKNIVFQHDTAVQYGVGYNLSKQPFSTQHPNHRHLLVESDLVLSSFVGNKYEGLLRKITLDRSNLEHHFEFDQLQFHPLRKKVFKTIEIDIKHLDDSYPNFKSNGVTVLTLWLSRRSQRQ